MQTRGDGRRKRLGVKTKSGGGGGGTPEDDMRLGNEGSQRDDDQNNVPKRNQTSAFAFYITLRKTDKNPVPPATRLQESEERTWVRKLDNETGTKALTNLRLVEHRGPKAGQEKKLQKSRGADKRGKLIQEGRTIGKGLGRYSHRFTSKSFT